MIKKILLSSIVIIGLILYLGFFNYVYIKEDGVYYNRFLSLNESYYPWRRLEKVVVDGYIPARKYKFPWQRFGLKQPYIIV